jgi:hypothetical protein
MPSKRSSRPRTTQNLYPTTRKPRATRKSWIGHKGPNFVVLSKAGKDSRGNTLWLAVCGCTNEFKITTSALGRPEHYKSCGCWRASGEAQRGGKRPSQSLGSGVASRNKLISNYRRQAARRGYLFELTVEQCEVLFAGDCHYCGVEPHQTFFHRTCDGTYTYNGIDRQDNTLGYTTSNAVSCCGMCNKRKNNSSEAEFLQWIQRVHAHLFKGAPA